MGWMWSGVWVRTLPRGLDVVRSISQDTSPWLDMVRSTGQDTAPWVRCGQDTAPWVGCSQEYRSGHCPVGWMWSGV